MMAWRPVVTPMRLALGTFIAAFVVVGLFSCLSIPITRRMPPGAGDEIARGNRGRA